VALADLLRQLLGSDLPIAIEAYDGSRLGPADAPATLLIRSPTALRRIVQAPGELGFARAYVAGDIDLEGDIFAALALRDHLPDMRLRPAQWLAAMRLVGPGALKPVRRPQEEARLHGRRHTKRRDAAAIAHHYDVSNDFYRRVLGPSMTYSCAVWTAPSITLEDAQSAKHELICRKLGLEPGVRLLDIGCGWGGMLLHAAERHGVQAVGVTLSKRQVELAEKRAAEAGLAGKIEVRFQDYRDVTDGPYDAVSSIGMFEHVGLRQLGVYFERCHELLRPGGRLLNHAISRPAGVAGSTADGRARFGRRSFIDRYVFPDGELHEVGAVISAIQRAGFEARHMESIREHYALTLRRWVANLEANWDACVADAGRTRARIWRLYMAASAIQFEANRTQVHQVLAVKPDNGRSCLPLRSRFE
jgi:cyclopropane-fatty-acyl-phospholipid synthase